MGLIVARATDMPGLFCYINIQSKCGKLARCFLFSGFNQFVCCSLFRSSGQCSRWSAGRFLSIVTSTAAATEEGGDRLS